MPTILPGIMTGNYEPWQFYQLATMCRLNYSNSAEAWARLRQTMRTNWTRQETTGGNPIIFPKVTLLQLTDYQLVIVNGSTTLQDWIDDVKNVVMTAPTGQPTHGVGNDWWGKADAAFTLLLQLGLTTNKPVIFTGHSLGGAIAVCMLYRWKQQNPAHQGVAVSFGCPRVATPAFTTFAGGTHFRVVNGWDLVSGLPTSGWHFNPPSLLSSGSRYQRYEHAGTMYWLNRSRPGVLTAGGSDYSGFGYWQRLYGSPLRQLNPDPIQVAVEGTLSHRVFAYVERLRKECEDVPAFSLWGFDAVNSVLNDVFAEEWTDPSILLRGQGKRTYVLNGDPPVPMPAPPAENQPLDNYERVVRRGPAHQPVPLPPREIQERQTRRRRNFG